MVLSRGVKLSAASVLLGALMALGVGQALKALLYRVAPTDAWVLGGDVRGNAPYCAGRVPHALTSRLAGWSDRDAAGALL